MAKLPIRESRKGREGILVRAQEANGEIRWPTYIPHTCAQTHAHKSAHSHTETNNGKTDLGCQMKMPLKKTFSNNKFK